MSPSDYTPTELRVVLSALIEMELSGAIDLPPWQSDLIRLRVRQAHYTAREKLQILRIVLEHKRSGALDRAAVKRQQANSPSNLDRVGRACNAHAGHGSNKSGNFPCIVCPQGEIYYHIGAGTLAAICTNRQCVRLISPEIDKEDRQARFYNIIPQDIGTFLVESQTTLGVYYSVDVVEQTCFCEDFRFRHADGHKCKHLHEVNHAVFVARAF